jgi:hypothetical protein
MGEDPRVFIRRFGAVNPLGIKRLGIRVLPSAPASSQAPFPVRKGAFAVRPSEPPERSPGGVLLRLFANRNPGRWAAYAIMMVTGRGLDINAADLSVVTGVGLHAQVPLRPPGTTETAKPLWDVRRLSTDQVRHVRDAAKLRGRESGEAGPRELMNSCAPAAVPPTSSGSTSHRPHFLAGVTFERTHGMPSHL